ncbi:MAG: GTP-binding protein [Actinomycetales bacterium]|nr:GTP-binding protein [Actinomycetales bacterium]
MTSGAVPLRARVRDLLLEAAEVYRGRPWEARLRTAAEDGDSPLRVALAGRVKAGKSTLLNALVGVPVAPTDAGECTKVVTWYVHGEEPEATAWLRSGRARGDGRVPLDLRGGDAALRVDLGGLQPEDVDRVEVRLPSPRLERLTLIDTPGLASLSPRFGERTERFLTEGDEVGGGADAVLFLMRQLHAGDVNLLEAFRDPQARPVPPVNAIGILSRADEIGGGRPDALAVARRLAEGYSQDPRLRPLLQTVVPVAGLLAQAAATLSDEEYRDLRETAEVPAAVLDPMLLSAIRFAAPRRGIEVASERRRALVDRLGLFGVRWALALLRSGEAGTRDDLAGVLSAASGMTELRWMLDARITGRRDAIKADAALRLLLHAAATDPVPGIRRLAAAAEQLRLGVHDVAELRVLNELRTDGLALPAEVRRRMERVLGAEGADVRVRLDLPREATVADVERALLVEHAHWQRLAADLLTPPEVKRASSVLQRTCEGLRRDLRVGASG